MEFIASPNKSDSSFRKPIDRIVIHWFGVNDLQSAINHFLKPNSTSAHYLISKKRIVQMVDESEVAWHAGLFSMNQRSIGIEHDATVDHDAHEDTYKTSAKLIADISKRYSIPLDRTHIIKHSEVVPTQCCGTVDVDKLIKMAKDELGGTDECTERVRELEVELDGVRSSRNDWRAKSKEQDITIAGLENEIENRKEQVARKDELIAQKEQIIKGLLEKPESCDVFKQTITGLEVSLDQASKEKGRLSNKVVELEKIVEQMNNTPRDVSLEEAFKVIVDFLFKRFN